ncbi:hypothetical protein [Bradyrhizobium sp. dw_78]|uniref:hypothetical protein n=1 Tax=Bradyrhizobium sp. dw_78 TaxID=2719793 RepID=UPI001BD4166E|nr:hypothetical protein [Bradyrhizobium sp. dw_78]
MVGFPLLLIPVAIYNIIVFLMPGVSFTETLVNLPLVSGAEWPVTLSDVLLTLGILLLLLEVIKGARPGAKYLTDHLLSLIIFGCAAAEFVMWPRFGNSTYFLLALLSLADFLSGSALHVRRGRAAVAAPAISRQSARNSEPPAAEPHFNPAPMPAPASVSVPAPEVPAAEAVPLGRSEPDPVQPAASSPASPQVPSPELQPGGVPPSAEQPPR